MKDTGAERRSEGPRCRRCGSTEARCAFNDGCCPLCSHWKNWTIDGEPFAASTTGGRPLAPVVDAVTAKRREQWRRRYQQRRAS